MKLKRKARLHIWVLLILTAVLFAGMVVNAAPAYQSTDASEPVVEDRIPNSGPTPASPAAAELRGMPANENEIFDRVEEVQQPMQNVGEHTENQLPNSLITDRVEEVGNE